MQASGSQPRYAPLVHHVRRPSRPQSMLETLVERRDSESDTAVLRPPPAAAAARARPASFVMSAPAQNHMPRSIFPDVPVSRRSSTMPVPPTPPAASIPVSRRHTTYLAPAPMAVPPRREQRPLRSSPLAGPSLALSDDGTLTGSDESFETRRFRPNRISSTPDVTMSALMQLEGKSVTSLSEPNSPAGTYRGAAPLALDQIALAVDKDKALPTPEPPKKSAARRLSLGFKRLSGLPGLPKSDADDKSDAASIKSNRSHTLSMLSGKSKEAAPPPVPSIPVWARPSYMPEGAHLSASPTSPSQPSEAKSILRRPTSAGEGSSTPSTRRRSVLYASHETLPSPSSHAATPSTSHNPEQNWMTAAAAPRFSRLGLKGDGVVLPLTAKEVRRRSTIRVAPSSPTSPSSSLPDDTRAPRSMRSGTSLRSLAASFQSLGDTPELEPLPRPPFRSASRTSVNSTESEPDTPSLSRASSDSGASLDGDGPHTPGADELGVLRPHQPQHKDGGGVELRVNDVTVEIIGLRAAETERLRRAKSAVELGGARAAGAGAPPERKGTLRRVWRRLTGSSRR